MYFFIEGGDLDYVMASYPSALDAKTIDADVAAMYNSLPHHEKRMLTRKMVPVKAHIGRGYDYFMFTAPSRVCECIVTFLYPIGV